MLESFSRYVAPCTKLYRAGAMSWDSAKVWPICQPTIMPSGPRKRIWDFSIPPACWIIGVTPGPPEAMPAAAAPGAV